MKRDFIKALSLVISFVLLLAFCSCENQNKNAKTPYKDLRFSDIKSVTAFELNPERSGICTPVIDRYELDDDEITELLDIICSIKTYGADTWRAQYIGDPIYPMFTIKKKDGSEISLRFSYPDLNNAVADREKVKLGEEFFERISAEHFPTPDE